MGIYVALDMMIYTIFVFCLLPYSTLVLGLNNYNFQVPSIKTTYVHLQEQNHPSISPPAKTHLTKGVVVRVPVHKQEEEYSNKYQDEKEEERLVIVVPVPSTSVEKPSAVSGSISDVVPQKDNYQLSGTKDDSFYHQQQAKSFGTDALTSQGSAYGAQQKTFGPRKVSSDAQSQVNAAVVGHQPSNAFTQHRDYTGRTLERFPTNADSFDSQQLKTNAKLNEGSYGAQSPVPYAVQQQGINTMANSGFSTQNQGTSTSRDNEQHFSDNFSYNKGPVIGAQHSASYVTKDAIYENNRPRIFDNQPTYYKNQKPFAFPQDSRGFANQHEAGVLAQNAGHANFNNRSAQHVTAAKDTNFDSSFVAKDKLGSYSNQDNTKGTFAPVKLSSTVKFDSDKSISKFSTSEKPRKQTNKKIPVLLISLPSAAEKSQSTPSKISYDTWRPMKTSSGNQNLKADQGQSFESNTHVNYYQTISTLNQPQYKKDQYSYDQTSRPSYTQANQGSGSHIRTSTNNKEASHTILSPEFNRDRGSQISYRSLGQSRAENFNQQQANSEKSQNTYIQPEPKIPQVNAFQVDSSSLSSGLVNEQRGKIGKQNQFGQSSTSFSQPNYERFPSPNNAQDSYLSLEPNRPQFRLPIVNFSDQLSSGKKSQQGYITPEMRLPQLYTSEATRKGIAENYNEQRAGKLESTFTPSDLRFPQQQFQNTNFGTFREQRGKTIVSHERFPPSHFSQSQKVQGTDYSRSLPPSFKEPTGKSEKPQGNYPHFNPIHASQVTSYEQPSMQFDQYEGKTETLEQPRFIGQDELLSEKTQNSYGSPVPSGFIRVQTAYTQPEENHKTMIVTSEEEVTPRGFGQINTEAYNEPQSAGKFQDNYKQLSTEGHQGGDKTVVSEERKSSKDGILLVLVSTKAIKDNQKSEEQDNKGQSNKKEQKSKKVTGSTKQKSDGADYSFQRRASVTAFTKTNDYHTGYSIVY